MSIARKYDKLTIFEWYANTFGVASNDDEVQDKKGDRTRGDKTEDQLRPLTHILQEVVPVAAGLQQLHALGPVWERHGGNHE